MLCFFTAHGVIRLMALSRRVLTCCRINPFTCVVDAVGFRQSILLLVLILDTQFDTRLLLLLHDDAVDEPSFLFRLVVHQS